MSRHEGVSCDSCLKSNFRGRRFKCLICYDYDLCATCYDAGATSTRHTTDHPMQCLIARSDFDIFFGGESVTAEQPQAFSCPLCSRMGFTEVLLQEHVTLEHAETSLEVVCPVCASIPGGDPNNVTDDLAAHLTLEHRVPREFDEPSGIRNVRRIPHPGRGVSGARTRRATNMHFASGGTSLAALSSPSGREAMDPIAELLSQLSSVRSRAAAAPSVSSQLQQLEMQLQSTRLPMIFRQQLERLPQHQQAEAAKPTIAATGVVTGVTSNAPVAEGATSAASNNNNSSSSSLYLLPRCTESVIDSNDLDQPQERSCRSLFIQELLLSTMLENLNLTGNQLDNLGKMSETVSTTGTPSAQSKINKSDFVDDVVYLDIENSNFNASKNLGEGAGLLTDSTGISDKTIGSKTVFDKVGINQKVATDGAVQSNGKEANSIGGRQSSIQLHSLGERHNQNVLGMRPGGVVHNAVDVSSDLLLNVDMDVGESLGFDDELLPLPGRPGSVDGDRESGLNQSTTKRNMVKHSSSTKTKDHEPSSH